MECMIVRKSGADTSEVTATAADVVAPLVFLNAQGDYETGTLVVQAYYYGADEPSADLGVDNDLYLITG